jgi:hypothetical protein
MCYCITVDATAEVDFLGMVIVPYHYYNTIETEVVMYLLISDAFLDTTFELHKLCIPTMGPQYQNNL